uniref:mucin-2 n=1 Tax=Doryrhamphus excisus TaxID=161450 RepID=UPI0025ADE5C2|nr:mucin-2 [Doryrhamphus excisus]XP_057939996.1 mucin-2 [Doryrhamphus excisus]XP_057939997.1 mucin-2 [Doryrhamphus excisus]XP_057939998.1 mucin-2 [Doryrhamphus excisus]XP_057939999.1 mucin-2 [Doryrhamphus excisus]XP_057940000.1 mucin-2 [Doryrhamphus excisus]XP_057940001.1 mucin-2 [Doryrhamphus excisus]XP_057940002.1 mucin-2 [Doryrhamphus excisus]XP_057940004.1 mucin-2 [Doryrhamphus excisus]XP_057940005.1 mucin-2 [Doryrhamphus excisus]
MMGGSDTGSGDKEGAVTTAIHIPIGWQRRADGGQVVYVSPSGTSLSSLDEVKTYLLTDGTCKCGLECPLVIHKVFNFSVGVRVEQHKQPLGRAEQDMTKLCNHRRKVVAMAALCRSMQASQLPFTHLQQPEVSSGMDSWNPKRALGERDEEDRGVDHPKLRPAPARPQTGAHPNPCASPTSSHQFIYPYNGSSPGPHTGTNSPHSLDALRRIQHHPLPLSMPAASSTHPSFAAAQRSPRTPTPQGQRTPKTPETPASPRLRPLSSPPSSSPNSFVVGGRVAQSQGQHGVTSGGSPLSPSPILSPSVQNMNCVSPHQRSRHPSASPSPLSEQGVGCGAAAEGPTGSNLPQRKKSCSSSPHSPLPCRSPNPNPNLSKFKLEDILEHFKNSGSNSTNNHHLSPSPNLLTNRSSSSPHAPSLKPSKGTASPSTGPLGFALNAAGLPVGPFVNHHSHQGKLLPPTTSFPASSLLSAAAKAQLTSQVTLSQGQMSSPPPSLEFLTEAQQKQSTNVTNGTLQNSHLTLSTAATRPHYPSLAAASSVLFPSSQSLAQSLASTLPHLPPKAERNASHRKRQRRSPTVLSMIRDTQKLTNRPPRKTPPGDCIPATAMNLSSAAFPHSSSTSDSVTSEHHHPTSKLSAPRQTAHLSPPPPRQCQAVDVTTGLVPPHLAVAPPTQPLSAFLHLLSVQNAHASASNPVEGSEHTKMQRLSPGSVTPHFGVNNPPPSSPCRTNNTNTTLLVQKALSPPRTSVHFRSVHSQSEPVKSSSLQRHSPTSSVPSPSNLALHSRSPSRHMTPLDRHQPTENHISTPDSRVLSQEAMPTEMMVNNGTSTAELSPSQGSGVSVAPPTSPKPLDLSNHVLALLAASSTACQEDGSSSDHLADVVMSSQENLLPGSEESGFVVSKSLPSAKPLASTSPEAVVSSQLGEDSPDTPSALSDPTAALPLAEAFPFMNQEQLLQLLSSTGGLPSILDPAVLSSLHLEGLWLGGQNAQIPPPAAAVQTLSEQQPLLIQAEAQQHSQDPQQQKQQQQQMNGSPLFPLLPLLSSVQGDLPLNLLGLLNPIPPPVSTTGQEADLGLTEKPSLQALLMASLLLGQQQAPLLPLSGLGQLGQVSLEVPLQHPPQIPATLEGLTLDKTAGLLDPTALHGAGLLEVTQGLPLPPGAEGSIQALQSLLLPAALPPHPTTFLPLSPALLAAALNAADLSHTHLGPAQQTQNTQPQELSDAGVDTLIPLSLQGKDNPILQQLLPTLLNPAVLGDISSITGLHNMVGIGAGSILLPPVQTSSLGMPLLQGPDGTINLLNNVQLNLAPSSEEKSNPLQVAHSPAPHEDIPATQISPEGVASPARTPAQEPSQPSQRGSEGRAVIDPYTSFMDTIYNSFLQINAKEQEEGVHSGPSDPSSPFCALPPVSFPMEHDTLSTPAPTQHQASAPVSLSPRRACSLRNPDLSRLSLEAAAHSPAQGTPKPTEDGATSPLQRKPVMVEGHTHPEPPLPSIYLEEAKTDCTGPAAAVCPYAEAGVERQAGYLSPSDGCSRRPTGDCPGTLLHSEQGREQSGAVSGARRGRKRKQTLQNMLEDFRDVDATTALEDTKATTALLKPDTSARGRRRRGARSQRQ